MKLHFLISLAISLMALARPHVPPFLSHFIHLFIFCLGILKLAFLQALFVLEQNLWYNVR